MFPKALTVKSLGQYRLHLGYSDGLSGILDISHLAHQGIFKAWEQDNLFDRVYLDPETGAIAWNDTLDICPDAAYLTLRGMPFEQWKSQQMDYAHD